MYSESDIALGFCLISFFLITVFILVWSRTVKNFLYYRERKPFFASIVLCRTRIIFGLEVAGIFLLVLKLAFPGPSQEEYNDLLANALLANAHSTSMVYQALRKEIPVTLPPNVDASQLNLPKTISKDPEKLFDELHTYVRRSSMLIAKYFGDKLPECVVHDRPTRLLNLDPDTELVSIEIARRSSEKSLCGEMQMSRGISTGLLLKSIQATGIEILGGIFLLCAALLKFFEIREVEKSRKMPNIQRKWYWNEDNIQW